MGKESGALGGFKYKAHLGYGTEANGAPFCVLGGGKKWDVAMITAVMREFLKKETHRALICAN